MKLFKIGDILFWLLLMIGGYWGQAFIASPADSHSVALVEIDGEVKYRLDLREDRQFQPDQFNSSVTIRVRHNAIAIIANNCPQQICVEMGPISHAGEMIVCVPKKILIYIPVKNERKESVKAITG